MTVFRPNISETCFFDKKPTVTPFTAKKIIAKIVASKKSDNCLPYMLKEYYFFLPDTKIVM